MARGWWSARIRRTVIYFRPLITESEKAGLDHWLSPAQLRLFDSMHPADRRHGLDVVTSLKDAGAAEPGLLMAGLLHDCGKGRRIRLGHRVAWSLGQRYGAWIWWLAGHLPTFRSGLARLRDHAALSAELAREAGCDDHTVELIRNQETPIDDAGRLLRTADEDN